MYGSTGGDRSKLVDALEGEHELRLGAVPDDPRWRQVDVTDIDMVADAAEGVDAVLRMESRADPWP